MASHMVDSALFKDQFGTEEMRRTFDDRNLLQKWMDVEAALARAEAAVGLIRVVAACARWGRCVWGNARWKQPTGRVSRVAAVVPGAGVSNGARVFLTRRRAVRLL